MDRLMISVSTEPAKTLKEATVFVEECKDKCDMFHMDIMDGVFVEKKNETFKNIQFFKSITTLPLDVHLMVQKPKKAIKRLCKLGVNIITVHFEAFEKEEELVKILKFIKKKKMLVGLSIKPRTKPKKIEKFLEYVDLVLVMSVEPGQSGQKFIDITYDKIKHLNNLKNEHKFMIEVDGGVTPEITEKLEKLGVDIIVSASYLYNSKDKEKAIKELKKKSNK